MAMARQAFGGEGEKVGENPASRTKFCLFLSLWSRKQLVFPQRAPLFHFSLDLAGPLPPFQLFPESITDSQDFSPLEAADECLSREASPPTLSILPRGTLSSNVLPDICTQAIIIGYLL